MAEPPAARSSGARNGRDRAHELRRFAARLFGPAHQRIAAEGHARRPDDLAPLAHPRQDPADFLEVPGVVGTRRQIEFAAAAAEMRHGIVPAALARKGREGFGIVAARRSLESMEQHEQGLGPSPGRRGNRRR